MVGMADVMRRGAPLVAAMLLVGACSDTAADPTTTTAPSTTVATTTTTTVAPTTTTTTTTTTTAAPTTTTVDPQARPEVLVSNVDRDSVDDFDTSGDNLYRVAMELRDLFVYLEGNPTDDANAMVSLIFERDYPYWNPIMVGFLELTDNTGWHYSDPGVETLAIDVVSVEDTNAIVRVADLRAEQVISDANGDTVKTYSGWDRRVSEFTLERGTDGLWRYADALPSTPISDDDLASMVPVEWQGRS